MKAEYTRLAIESIEIFSGDAVKKMFAELTELERLAEIGRATEEHTAILTRVEDETRFDYGVCSNCGKMHPDWDGAIMFNYCPNCGARFKEAANA